ncbi:MAG TPA: PTS sugar transporter subunit IIA [Spirochaetia bacterium]|nr:PTS sugar transporter subunit IIA [Spirochaetia bacterium]
MSTTHCFRSGTVVAELLSTDKFDAIRETIRRAPVFRALADVSRFEEAVIERERQHSTGFGHGVAVAHGRVEGVSRVLIGLGISRLGIPFDAPDGEPVRLLFVIASPPSLSLEYLQTLSTLVRCLREKEDRDLLLDSPNPKETERRIRASFLAGLERFEEPLPRSAG